MQLFLVHLLGARLLVRTPSTRLPSHVWMDCVVTGCGVNAVTTMMPARELARAAKKWARARGLYGEAEGHLGGWAWALLAAFAAASAT